MEVGRHMAWPRSWRVRDCLVLQKVQYDQQRYRVRGRCWSCSLVANANMREKGLVVKCSMMASHNVVEVC